MIALCNIFKFNYYFVYGDQILIDLNKTNIENLQNLTDAYDNFEIKKINEIIEELNENISKYYIPQHIPVVIILAIFQFTFIALCTLLLKIRSWRWIKESKLNNNKKWVHIIYQLEGTLLSITTSFLGIWISKIYILYYWQPGEVFGVVLGAIIDIFDIITIIPICTVFIAIQKNSKILYSLFYFASLLEIVIIIELLYTYYIILSTHKSIPTVLFLIILNVNTILCQKYINEKVATQRKEPDLDLNKLSVNEWKFVPKSEISLLEIVTVKSDKNNKNNGAVGVKNDKNTSKKDHSVEIFFNAKSDVMIQTNYPLPKALKKDTSSISSSLSPPVEYYYYEITILSNQNIDKTIIAIGLTSKNCSTDKLPGCDAHSVGFHSDEGRTFRNEGYTGSKYAEKWGEINDVIGCGYCPSIGQVFFTMNGKNLGIAYTGLFHPWYPTIGSNGVCSLKVNFGQEEFKYKEANGMSVSGMLV
ncbi:uncharacterized protein OCT59_028900 [Rhizophagus irregularis]|uniref:uncharacterized protein n=1 Tax=Rhizophagus irregularis TaxID=588596 RepID=UPI003324C741|nr:hypothetical protein OCT59_028900 [Rhizophagus irregularis]